MKRHEELMADIQSELAAFRNELDEYEQTLETVEGVLDDSKLGSTASVSQGSAAAGAEHGGVSAGAD